MARSILFSIMFIAGALGVVIFSAAQFTDAEDTTSNTVQAGTIDLNDPAAISCVVPAAGLEGAPSVDAVDSETTCTFTVRHTGSLPEADLYAQVVVTSYPCTNAEFGLNDGSEYCNANPDLTAAQFHVLAATIGANAPGFPETSGSPLLSDYLTTAHTDSKTLAGCTKIVESMPIDTDVPGSLTLQLDQLLTSNVMQGDAITLTINFELAEHGSAPTSIDCVLDTSTQVTPPSAP